MRLSASPGRPRRCFSPTAATPASAISAAISVSTSSVNTTSLFRNSTSSPRASWASRLLDCEKL